MCPWHGTSNSESVEIFWPSLDGNIEDDFLEYYGYIIQYRVSREISWKTSDIPALGSTNNYTYQLDRLQYHTVYEIQVSLYRQLGECWKLGQPTQILELKTACTGQEQIRFELVHNLMCYTLYNNHSHCHKLVSQKIILYLNLFMV